MTTRFCIESLGSARYANILFKILPKDWGFSGFATVFGDFLPVAEQGAKRGHPVIKIQAVWQGGNHIYGQSHLQEAIKQAKRFDKLAVKYPNVEFQFSPFCEYSSASVPFNQVRDAIQPLIPHMQLLNVPMQVNQFVNGYRNEIHHGFSGTNVYQVSHDGIHSVDTDIQRFKIAHKNAILFWLWVKQFNLIRESDTFIEPLKRKCLPTIKLFKSVMHLTNDKLATHLDEGWVYKSHADQHNDVDLRAGKPVVVTPKGKACKKVVLIEQLTNKKYDLKDGGFTKNEHNEPNFKPRQTWRCNYWGFEMGRLFDVKADGKLVGTVDAGFRENEYRNE